VITAVAYASEGSSIIVGTDLGLLSLWESKGGAFSVKAEHAPEDLGLAPANVDLRALAVAPDSRSVACACYSGSQPQAPVRVFDIASSRTRLSRFDYPDDGQGLRHGVFSVLAFSPDGKTLAAGRRDGVVLFDEDTARCQGVLQAEKRIFFNKLAFSPGRPSKLASSSLPWEVQIFDVASKRKVQVLKPPDRVSGKPFDPSGPGKVEVLTFSPDGARLAVSTWRNSIFLWDASNGDLVAAIQEGLGSAWTEGRCILAFTPDGAFLLTASRGLKDISKLYARKRDAATGELVSQMELIQPGGPFPYVYPRAIAPDGKSLAAVGAFTGGPENSWYESILVIYDLEPLFGASASTGSYQKPADAAVANAGEVTFLGTVTSVDIGNLHHPYLRWVVTLTIDNVISGDSPGEGFWFAIHSPSLEAVKVGQRYRITAIKDRDGFELVSRQRVE
jgi:hypothetical protein